MSSINSIGFTVGSSTQINDPIELLITHGSSTLKEAIEELPKHERHSLVSLAAPLIEKSSGYRDDRDLLKFVSQVPQEERLELVEQVKKLIAHGNPIVSVVFEALGKVNREEREDMIRHVQAFLSGHDIGAYEISDAIYKLIKICPNKRLALIENVTTLTCQMSSGVYRCGLLEELNEVPILDQYSVIKHAHQLITYLGGVNDTDYAHLVRAIAAVSVELRSEVIESAKPLLIGLNYYNVTNLFLILSQMDREERETTVKQLLPLAKLTSNGFFRGQLLLALRELPLEQRDPVVQTTIPFLREEIWWCNSVDSFIRIAAATPCTELIELHIQVKNFLKGAYGHTVDVLMATAQVPKAERQALLNDVKPLLIKNMNLQEFAALLTLAGTMERDERQQVVRYTARMLCPGCTSDILRLFQVIRGLPSELFETILHSLPGRNNSEIIEMLLNFYERITGEPFEVAESLSEALKFWIHEAKDPSRTVPVLELYEEEQNICLFLAKLKTTEEHKNPQTRILLARRILEVFTVMQDDKEIKELATGIASIGLESCADRVITALDEIELQVKLYTIKKIDPTEQREALKKLSSGFLLLAMIREKIKKLLVNYPHLDEIGLHLALQIRLAKTYELPVSTSNMVFTGCIGVPVTEIDAVVLEVIKEYTEARKEEFLSTWQPWMDFERAHEVVPAYEELSEVVIPPSDIICLISQEPPRQPVMYDRSFYDYDHFILNYRKTGIDPITRSVIDLKRLKRLQK